MALSQKDRQQLLGFLIFLAIAVIGGYWYFLWNPKRTDPDSGLVRLRQEIDSLRAAVDTAKQDLAAGTMETLQQRIDDYEASLDLMRRLVPTEAEVPTLIDEIASRAALRGVQIAEISQRTVEPGNMFDTHRYRLSVLGHFDQMGEFLADVASLPRIMVPFSVSLTPASETAQMAMADTSGALLTVAFQLRTFVKSRTAGGTGEGS